MKNAIVDSDLPEEVAKSQNPKLLCPPEILARQAVMPVHYWSFDKKLHRGQIVIDAGLMAEVAEIFEVIRKEKFPIASAVPAADARFHWNDELLMDKNITSAFNYRLIDGETELSLHAYGRAIDINPRLNPYINADGVVKPRGARRDITQPGTITGDSFLVRLFEKLGWEWGGRWTGREDWHHFQKESGRKGI